MVVSSLSLLKCRGLIALSPFISSKLMNLPDLLVDHVLAIVLKTINDYDRKMDRKKEQVTIDLAEDTEEEKEKELEE
jgi:hypothetical protein